MSVWYRFAFPSPLSNVRMAEAAWEGVAEVTDLIGVYDAGDPSQVQQARFKLGKALVQLTALAEQLGFDADELARQAFYGVMQFQGGPESEIPWTRPGSDG